MGSRRRFNMARIKAPIRRSNPVAACCLLLVFLAAACSSIPRLQPGASSSQDETRDIFEPGTEKIAEKVIQPDLVVLDYLQKRGMDLLDTLSFRITAGPGIRGHARVTKYIQAGLGYMGPADGKTMGHTFPVYKFGFIKREGGLWKERTVEMGISVFYDYQTEGELVKATSTISATRIAAPGILVLRGTGS